MRTVIEFINELNKIAIRDKKWLQEIADRIVVSYGVSIPVEVIATAMDFAGYTNGLTDEELVSLSLQNGAAVILDRDLLLSKKVWIGFYLKSGGSTRMELSEEMLNLLYPVLSSDQPEFFCTNCGVETSKVEDEAHAYLCDKCAG